MIFREFWKGFVRVHVLHRAARGPVYGLAVRDELQQQGYTLGPGTLYPLLHGLEKAGYLAREDRIVGGRVRKYYITTRAGARALAEARSRIHGLVGEVLADSSPPRLREPKFAPGGRVRKGLVRPEILHAQLTAKIGDPAPTVIDVRDRDEYLAGHIPGARHIPADEIATRVEEFRRQFPHVTYCNMRHGRNARSVMAARILRKSGRQAQALDGGFPAWVASGYPVDREVA